MDPKRLHRGDPYDPDRVEIREELGQLRRRAKRAGRTMAEQAEHEEAAAKEREANRKRPPSHGYSTARLLGWDRDGKRIYSQADPMEADRYL